jgi:hypothetical protein
MSEEVMRCAADAGKRPSIPVDVDDGLGKGLGSFPIAGEVQGGHEPHASTLQM